MGETTDRMIFAEAISYDITDPSVFFQHDFLLVKSYVKTGIGSLKVCHFKIVYQHIRKDGLE